MRTATETEALPPARVSRYCSACGAIMMRARVSPKFLADDERNTYECPRCGNVITWDLDDGASVN